MSDLEETLKPLVDRCRPLKVTVKLRRVKDKYYIDFDGTPTYTSIEQWKTYWLGFDRFIKEALRLSGFKNDQITIKDESHATAFIGTLFDFLVKEHE